jgi:purine-nucleoside phosphorylase
VSIHIDGKRGDIAETILLPGDPLRARFVAETYLDAPTCYTQIRNVLGFTGTYRGKPVSVQGTGMGIPSISIYAHELINEFGVKNLIRIGSCGSIRKEVGIRDIILAMTASTDSQTNKLRFDGKDFSPTASFTLLKKAYDQAMENRLNVSVGNVFTTDLFYHDNPDYWKLWADYGVLAIEMETTALYTIAAHFNVHALTILTVSDNILTGEKITAEEREQSFTDMIELALTALG